ncbi:MAG TPA: DUF92 domain-containing protein [Gemmatimonadota bacterium]|nr:DUF92 domain-containing protein [Gemmatimonadota bacterium]
MITTVTISVATAAAVAFSAWRFGALDRGGAVAATAVGALVFGFGGLGAATVLVFFFVTASALSALPGGAPRSRRGARQVLANGTVAALTAALIPVSKVAAVAFLGAVAAATADTWATEIGIRWGGNPRSILSFKRQNPGTSGAVSLAGTLGSAAGAVAVGGVGAWLVAAGGSGTVLAVGMAGLGGAVVDSLLGASLQAVYRCPECGATPEVARHSGCSEQAQRVSGVPGLDNDAVNGLATFTGAVLALLAQGVF